MYSCHVRAIFAFPSGSAAHSALVFYLQLYAVVHGVDPQFSKYAVGAPFTGLTMRHLNNPKITVMNAGSLFGRTIPNVVADYYGPLNGKSPFSLPGQYSCSHSA